MALAEVQGALARLYTDAALPARFFADPVAVAPELGLSPEEARQLGTLQAEQIHFFADTLRRKRLGEVRALLPLTHRLLGRAFVALFWQIAPTYVPRGIHKHRDDALAFVAFLERAARAEGVTPAWALDLARYEAAWLLVTEPTRRWTLRWFHYPVATVAQALARGAILPALRQQRTIGLWVRLSGRHTPRHLLLALPVFLERGPRARPDSPAY
jgi:hypothetical protein